MKNSFAYCRFVFGVSFVFVEQFICLYWLSLRPALLEAFFFFFFLVIHSMMLISRCIIQVVLRCCLSTTDPALGKLYVNSVPKEFITLTLTTTTARDVIFLLVLFRTMMFVVFLW